jgi:acetyltransferase
VATTVAPLNEKQAEQLIDKTRAGQKLQGWRNLPPADRNAVVHSIRRVAQIAADFPQIQELEINPLYVLADGKGAFAVDVRASVQDA